MSTTYDWELYDDDDQMHAGGSCPDLNTAHREAQHYLSQYAADGPHYAIVKRCTVIFELKGGE